MPDLKVGDIVELLSGGPQMTVLKVHTDNPAGTTVVVGYFIEDRHFLMIGDSPSRELSAAALKLVTPNA